MPVYVNLIGVKSLADVEAATIPVLGILPLWLDALFEYREFVDDLIAGTNAGFGIAVEEYLAGTGDVIEVLPELLYC